MDKGKSIKTDPREEPGNSGRRIISVVVGMRTLVREMWLPFSILLSGVLVQCLAALSTQLTESLYGRTVYPYILAALSFFTRRVSFSLGEVLICIFLLIVSVSIVKVCVLLLLSRQERWRRLGTLSRRVTWVAALLLWLFLLTFGFNYQRPPLYELLGYEQRRATARELESLAGEIVDSVNRNYQEARARGETARGREEVFALLNESFQRSPDLQLLPRGVYAAPKPVYLSGLLTRFGISGIYFPFTSEPNYNADVPDFQLPFTIAHEMAHQRGVARESEANFVAYIVCVNSRDPSVRYSGYRHGLGVLSELYKLDPEKARELSRRLDPGYWEDSKRAALFWAKAAGMAGKLSYRVNDLYLRANRIKSGAYDYRGSTALIIGHYLHERSRTQDSPPL